MLASQHVSLVFPEGPAGDFSVRKFRIEESMNRPFRIVVRFVSLLEGIALDSLIGKPFEVRISFRQNRSFSGVCRAAKFVRVSETAEGLATYEVELVPKLWRLSQRTQSRVFGHQSVPDIVRSILDEWSIKHAWRIDLPAHVAREQRIQYAESDLTFVSRLLEEAGIAFWFEETDLDSSTLVLGDSPQEGADAIGAPIAFIDDRSMALGSPDFVTKLEVGEESRPGKVTLRDHDFWRPRYALTGSAVDGPKTEAAHEQYFFSPGAALAESEGSVALVAMPTPVADDLGAARHADDTIGDAALLAIEALHADRRVIRCESSFVTLHPGAVFQIVGHPRHDVAGQPLLSIANVLEGETADAASDAVWTFWTTAVPTTKPYRPSRVTQCPKIHGIHTAVVVGERGLDNGTTPGSGGVGTIDSTATTATLAEAALVDDDIYVDEHGRVRVQFAWDRGHHFSSASSIWIRVSQGWAGSAYGIFTIPRVGHEVLVAFVDGDPDSPIVVGRVHNLREPVPYPLPANKTVSTWKTSTAPGGAGFNELRFDDAAGRQHVYLQAERDMDQLVKQDLKQAVGRDRNRYVERDEGVGVGGSKATFVNHDLLEVAGLTRMGHVGVNRVSSVGVEDATLVGTRWSVTIARGMGRKLARTLDSLASELGGALRTAAANVLGHIPTDPMSPPADATLAGLGASVYDKFKDVLGLSEGFENDPGPLPTCIEMVDRQIRLTTGEATIVLDGPNITFFAAGKIAFHAENDVLLTSEREIALGARARVAVVSAEEDVIVQAARDLHLNPYKKAGELSPLGTSSGGKPKPDEVRLCTLHDSGECILDRNGRCSGGPRDTRSGGQGVSADRPPPDGPEAYALDAAPESELVERVKEALAGGLRSPGYAKLLPEIPEPDALESLHLRMLDNAVGGRDPFEGAEPIASAAGPMPGWRGPEVEANMFQERSATLKTVSAAQIYFDERRIHHATGWDA